MGIPTKEKMPNERYLPHLKMYVTGFETSPFGIEWMRFEMVLYVKTGKPIMVSVILR